MNKLTITKIYHLIEENLLGINKKIRLQKRTDAQKKDYKNGGLLLKLTDFLPILDYHSNPESFITKKTRFYLIKKILLRILKIFSKVQIAYNQYVLQYLRLITEYLTQDRREVQGSINQLSKDLKDLHKEVELATQDRREVQGSINSLSGKLETQQINNIENLARYWALNEQISFIEISNFKKLKSVLRPLSEAEFFSQYGEDFWIRNNIKLPQKGTFVDVGAGDGITYSNTYFFEKIGWKGICIEPHPYNLAKASLYRKKVINCAVGLKEGKVKLYLSSWSPDWSSLKKPQHYLGFVSVECKRLDSILMENSINKIDILSIDTEGTEVNVLKSFSLSKWKPMIIIVEYNTAGIINKEIEKFFEDKSYKLVHRTPSNFIFLLNK